MSIAQIRKRIKLFFSVFTLLFALAYLSPSFTGYYTPQLKTAHAASVDAFVVQSGTALVSAHQQFCKITGLDYFIANITLNASSIEVATSKALFISLFDRNVFYVFTTINAP